MSDYREVYRESAPVTIGDYDYTLRKRFLIREETTSGTSYTLPTTPIHWAETNIDSDIIVLYRPSGGGMGYDREAHFQAGVAETSDERISYDGARTLTLLGSGNIKYVEWCTELSYPGATAKAHDKGKTAYGSIANSVAIEGSDRQVKFLNDCFRDCKQMETAPELPAYAYDLTNCFRGCTSLRTAPYLGDGPIFDYCFEGCTALAGNIEMYAGPNQTLSGIFENTLQDIFITPDWGDTSYRSVWEQMAATYTNVHYEANDNPIPAISNLRATRVAASGSTAYAESGQWAYLQATLTAYDQYIPERWTNSIKAKTITDNGATETPTWYPSQISSYPADVYCWINIGDTAAHTFTLQITDSVKTGTTEKRSSTSSVASYVLAKAYALVDAYHDDTTDSEGLAIGKFAEHADLLDVDMPIRARQELQVDRLLTADEDIALGLSCHTGTSPTAAGTTTKVVTTKTGDFTLTTDAYVVVRFTNATTTSTSLNVDGRGSKTAYYNGSRISSSNGAWAAGETCIFQYNGTRYNRIDYADTLPVDVRLAYQTMALGWDDVLS